jgi:outer membrane protein TolC
MRRLILVPLLALAAGRVAAAPLTADEAVKIALQHNTQIIQANASLLDAKAGMWRGYSGVLPSLSASVSRGGTFTKETHGFTYSSTPPYEVIPVSAFDAESYSTTQSLNARWAVLDLSAWTGWSSARQGMRSAEYQAAAARASVVLSTKQQFYTVVQAMHLARVNAQALKVARDSERRVRAMFEVGSVSKSDLLKAQVNTSQAELDSLTSDHAVTGQRILLAEQLGLPEMQLAEVDSTLSAAAPVVDPAAVLAEARTARPDLRAAEADVRSAELGLRSAHWARLPYVAATGSYTPDTRSQSKGDPLPRESKRVASASVSLNLDIFNGLAVDAGVASARARLLRSRETRDALQRNLESEVHRALLGYQEAVERTALASRTVESAAENNNLVQQKYNVGSATILDLVDSQVQLQRAQSNLVSALAAIRVAEAVLDQVRGRAS